MGSNKKRKKSRWKKVIVSLLIFIIIVGTAVMRFKRNGKTNNIMTTKLKIGKVEEKLTETGNIELLRTVDVKSKIAGTVEEILVKEGDRVIEGQVLCVIDPDPTQTLLLFQKRSSQASTRINLEQARKEAERKRELAKSALISTKEFEDAENAFLIARKFL